MVKYAQDLTGKKFTRLLVVERDMSSYPDSVKWFCKCDCGTVKSINRSKLLNNNTMSCGCLNKELSSERQKENNTGLLGKQHPMYGRKGEDNPNYGRRKENPKTPENRIIRMRSDYVIWRSNVYERDNYTCQSCCKHGGNLNAHHIWSFSSNKELRFDVSNGITLCKDCHREFHDIFGRFNNTSDQLEIYLYV